VKEHLLQKVVRGRKLQVKDRIAVDTLHILGQLKRALPSLNRHMQCDVVEDEGGGAVYSVEGTKTRRGMHTPNKTTARQDNHRRRQGNHLDKITTRRDMQTCMNRANAK
jgi:hypothetical protein